MYCEAHFNEAQGTNCGMCFGYVKTGSRRVVCVTIAYRHPRASPGPTLCISTQTLMLSTKNGARNTSHASHAVCCSPQMVANSWSGTESPCAHRATTTCQRRSRGGTWSTWTLIRNGQWTRLKMVVTRSITPCARQLRLLNRGRAPTPSNPDATLLMSRLERVGPTYYLQERRNFRLLRACR